MRMAVQTINDIGEIIDVFGPIVTCEDCVFFKRLSDDRLQIPYICMNPRGLVHPMPDGFCCYSIPKSKVVEVDHE